MRKNLIFFSLVALLFLSPAVLARDSNNNGNNPGHEGATDNPGENSPQNNGHNASTFSIRAGQTIHFGDHDADVATTTNEGFAADADDGNNFTTTSNVDDIHDGVISLNNGQKFNLTTSQASFLQNSGMVGVGTSLQITGNHSGSGNVVRIMKVQDPATGQMVMVRLHTNTSGGVNQFSVKSKGALSSFVATIVSFFQSLFGGGSGGPSPSPSATPEASMSPSPTPSPSENPSPTPSATP